MTDSKDVMEEIANLKELNANIKPLTEEEIAERKELLTYNPEGNNCRMYENLYPDIEDVIMVQVKTVAGMGSYVDLLEYKNIEGMILHSELSRRRIRSINNLIRVGRTEVVTVVRVDKDKGYVDLSKRRVYPEDVQKCEEKYNKSKAVHSIMRQVSEKAKVDLKGLYMVFGWDLYKRFGHAYDAFKLIVKNPEIVSKYQLDDKIKELLLATIRRRMTPQPVKLRADIEVTCFDYEGIEAIKYALRVGENSGTEDIPVKIKLVAPPLYVMMATTLHKQEGLTVLEKACEAIAEAIRSKGGDCQIKEKPRAVSERDDKLLTSLMETLEKQNMEVAGDEPDED